MKKRLVISFIVVQICVWFLLIGFPYFNPPANIDHYLLNFHVKHLGGYLLQIVFFNSLIFSWIPNFFQKKEFVFFGICIVFSLISVIAFETVLIEYFFPKLEDIGFRIHFFPARDLAIVLGIGIGFRALYDWLEQKEQQSQLIQEKSKAELAVLRHQLSPHFLFNTLNNITELMHQDVDEAEKYITRFSKLLREMLQKDSAIKLTLKEEIEFISNYIEIQKLRLNSNHELIYTIKGDYENLYIEPFLLINFIENIFKHGLSNQKSQLIIELLIVGSQLILVTKNSIHTGIKDQSTGIGMENVKKRLKICYPLKHELRIKKENAIFHLELKLELS